MKKIISGKSYDTTTAREVGSNSSSCSWSDFRHWCETLYCKRTGEYFLHGEGGPMTKYRHAVDSNSWSGGEAITPMSVAEAKAWAEENLSADEYEREFGAIAEDESKTVLSISIRTDVAERVRRAAAEAGISISEYIETHV